MRRREFLGVLGGAGVVWPIASRAQESSIARVGVLSSSVEGPAARLAWPAFIDELRKLGFAQGRNLAVEYRRIDQGTAQAFAGANELVAWRADVLFAFGPELGLQAAAAARPPVSIVILANNYDPITRAATCKASRGRAATSPASFPASWNWWANRSSC
jgi:putative tryptophan/tyrosine transport system substrate-binding protein